MQKGVQLMPPRHSSADILVVYLLLCLHLCIAKGTAAKSDSIQRGFVHQWWRHERSVGCCHTIGEQMFVYYVPLGSITRHLRMPNTRVQSVWSWQMERKVLTGNCISPRWNSITRAGSLRHRKHWVVTSPQWCPSGHMKFGNPSFTLWHCSKSCYYFK